MTTVYSMTPIQSGTRLRVDHNTFAVIIDVDPTLSNVQSFNMGDILVGDELWVAPADGSEVKQGDEWLHVTHRNGNPLQTAGWTARIHKGSPICNNFQIIGENPDPEPLPDPVFPQSFVLTDPEGRQAEYEFVRVIE